MATAAECRGRKVFQYFIKVRIFHSLVLLPCTLNFSYLKFFITWEETSSYSLVALCPNCIVSKVMFWRSYRIMWNIRTVQSDALYMHYIERVTIFSYLRYIFLHLRLWKWTEIHQAGLIVIFAKREISSCFRAHPLHLLQSSYVSHVYSTIKIWKWPLHWMNWW